MSQAAHIPVLVAETLAALGPRDGALYLDGTFGGGGWSEALLEAARCRVVAIDRDSAALRRGAALAQRFSGRLTLVEGRFGEMDALLRPLGIAAVNGVALDLGVSSAQLDEAERGFSFRADGPLDMRMGPDGASAADLVNTLSERDLAGLIRDYGEERYARRVARAIVRERAKAPITRTAALAALVRGAVPAARRRHRSRHPHVPGLAHRGQRRAGRARSRARGGRAAARAGRAACRRLVPFARGPQREEFPARAQRHRGARLAPPAAAGAGSEPELPALEPQADRAGRAPSSQRNPRARSARLRAAERTAAPPLDAQP